MSANPFSDCYADSPAPWVATIEEHEDKYDSKTIAFPKTFQVPNIKPLEPLRPVCSVFSDSSSSGSSTIRSPISPPSSPDTDGELEWTNEDLIFLLKALCGTDPEAVSYMFFSPPLDTLPSSPSTLFRLHLSISRPANAAKIPRSAYSAAAPIGTGRPETRTQCLASTGYHTSASAARRDLAATLLGDGSELRYMIAYYELLGTLCKLNKYSRESVARGMAIMMVVHTKEWDERWMQMCGTVDESWGFGARLEEFLLRAGPEVGKLEVGKWLVTVSMSEDERKLVANACGELGGFLEKVLRGL